MQRFSNKISKNGIFRTREFSALKFFQNAPLRVVFGPDPLEIAESSIRVENSSTRFAKNRFLNFYVLSRFKTRLLTESKLAFPQITQSVYLRRVEALFDRFRSFLNPQKP